MHIVYKVFSVSLENCTTETAFGRTVDQIAEHITNRQLPIEKSSEKGGSFGAYTQYASSSCGQNTMLFRIRTSTSINGTSLLNLVKKSSLAANSTSLGRMGSH